MLGGLDDHRAVAEDNEPPVARPSPTVRLDREITEIEAGVLLVALDRAVSATVTAVPDAGVVLEQLDAWARELRVDPLRTAVAAGPEPIIVRRQP